MMVQPEGMFVGAGGLPTRITQPEPSPLTRAASVQAHAAREIETLRGDMVALMEALQHVEGTLDGLRRAQATGAWTTPLTRTREVTARLSQMTVLLKELEQAITSANVTVETLRAERGQLQALCLIAEHLNASMSRPDLMARVIDDLLMLLHAERGAILLADDQGQMHFEAAREANGTRLSSKDYPISTSTVRQVWTTNQPMLVSDAQADARTSNSVSVRRANIHSIMCAPLRLAGKSLGIVYVDRLADEGTFTPNHLDLLAAFCNEAAIAIENANLFAAQQLHMQEIAAMKTYTDSILTSISSGVLAIDNDGRITRANKALEEILDLTAADVLDRPYDQVLAVIECPELHHRLQWTIAQPDVRDSLLIETSIAGHGKRQGPCTLSVGWSALNDNEQRRLGTVIVIDDLTDLQRAQHEARIFRRYVHPEVVDYVTQHPDAMNLGGQTREISVVFADVSGYTSLSEEMTPAALVDLLNNYLSLLTEAIFAEQGTVTMFQGDAVMAIFNAPPDQLDHPLRAVRAALAMRQALENYNHKTGRQPIQFSVGVNTGMALVGNIGARDRLQNYTAIGDVVNIAKRLEEYAAANQILLGEATMARVNQFVSASQLKAMSVKGKSQPLQVWELRGLR